MRTPRMFPLLLCALALACDEADTDTQDTSGGDTATDTDTVDTEDTALRADDIEVTTDENTAIVIDVSAHNASPVGLPLRAAAVAADDALGTVVLQSNGQIAWAPGGAFDHLKPDEEDEDTFDYTLTDGEQSGTASVVVVITGVNDPPVLRPISDQQSEEGDLVDLGLTATDPDDETLSWSASGVPPGLSLGNNGRITGALPYTAHDASPYTVTVTVSDGLESHERTFTWVVDQGDQPPQVINPGNRTNAESAVISLTVSGSDPEGDPISWSATGLPPNLAMNATTGEITGTLSYTANQGSPYTVTVTASDGSKSTDATFLWTVTNTNRPPTATPIADRTDAEGATIDLALEVTDPDTDDDHVWTVSPLPNFISVSGQRLVGTLTYASAGIYTVTATVSDGTATHATSFTWTVTNTNRPPEAWTISDQSGTEGQPITAVNASTGDPDGDTLSYTANNLPPGLAIHPTSGQITGTPTFDASGIWSVAVNAFDGTATTSSTFTFTIANVNRPPTLTVPAPGPTAEDTAVHLQVVASDPDGQALTYSATGLPPDLSIHASTGVISGTVSYDAFTGTPYPVQLTVSDGAAEASEGFAWTIVNTNRPPVLTPPNDRIHDEGDVVSFTVSATDPDLDALTYSAGNAATWPPGVGFNTTTGRFAGTLPYDAAGVYTITVTATDAHGATDQDAFQWTVLEAAPPPCLPTLTDVTSDWFPTEDAPKGWGVAALDYDNDGWQDLFVRGAGLWRNDKGDKARAFVNASALIPTSGDLRDFGAGDHGIAVGDLRQLGQLAIWLPNDSRLPSKLGNRLYDWNGTSFFDAAPDAGLTTPETAPWAASIMQIDLESTRYAQVLLGATVGTSELWLVPNRPTSWPTRSDVFDPRDLSGESVAWADFNRDGFVDLFVARQQGHRLFVNSSSRGNFDDEASARGVDGAVVGERYGGATWADIDGDGLLDLHLVVPGDVSDVVYLQLVDGKFEGQKATDFGLGDSRYTTGAAVWGDFDLDGDLDVLIPDRGLYENDGKGGYKDISADVGYTPGDATIGAWVDVDRDGDLDIVVLGPDQTMRVLRNDLIDPNAGECTPPGFAVVRVSGASSAVWDALGATIEVALDGSFDGPLAIHLVGQAQSGRSSQSQLWPVIGMGDRKSVDLRITWPDGRQEIVEGLAPQATGQPVLLFPR